MAIFAGEDIGDETGREGIVVFGFKPVAEVFLACVWIGIFRLGGRLFGRLRWTSVAAC